MSIDLPKLLIATYNKGKFGELKDLFAGRDIELRGLNDFENIVEVDETGSTFAENARLKARLYAIQTGMITLADDSGLEVRALDNRPGVFSARYGGAQTSFAEKMDKLLLELESTGDEQRQARFVCSIAVADASGNVLFDVEGACNGKIAPDRLGTGGFGFDPIFIPDGFDETFGELTEEIKQKISHRARAFNEIIPFLLDFIVV
jgi:XTP/dITP diphosphohydrolase